MAAHFKNEDAFDAPATQRKSVSPGELPDPLESDDVRDALESLDRVDEREFIARPQPPQPSVPVDIPAAPEPPSPRSPMRVVGRVLIALLAVVIVCGVGLGVLAWSVMGTASAAKSQASSLEQSLLDGDGEQARAQANELNQSLTSLRDKTHGGAWSVASHLPLVGRDIQNVQALTDCAADLSQNALMPIVDTAAGMRLSDLVQERAVDTGMLSSLRGAVVAASPTVVNSARTIASLEPGVVVPLNEKLDEFRTPLNDAADLLSDVDRLFSIVLSMLGDGGQTRTYVLLAQTNAEIRAGGGFPGSVGMVQVTDGRAELGEFHSVYEVKDRIVANGFGAAIGEDERAAFGDVLSTDAAGPTLTPNFVRSGQITKEQWENAYGYTVDGVIAMDPIFLQRVLALTGGVTAFDGTEVNGDNAAAELLHNVYMRYGFDEDGNEKEDAFFTNVADQAFGKLLDTMGGFEAEAFSQLWNIIRESGADHRFQVWMADGDQQSMMHDLNLTGEIQQDPAAPELGLYANDNTWSKMCWYLDLDYDLGAPQTNEDGTTTYHVTAHFRNTLTPEEAASVPGYITGYNPIKRDVSDMIETIYIMAPLGATISDYEVHQDVPLSEDLIIPDEHYTLYDRDTWRSRIQIMSGGDSYVTFTLNMPAGVGEPVVRTSPECR